MNHPGIDTGSGAQSESGTTTAAGDPGPDTTADVPSQRFSLQDIDELDGYLTRLDRLSPALPAKASLPNSPRSPSQRFHYTGPSIATGIDSALSSPSGPASPLSPTASSKEASPRASSALEPFASYIAASNWLLGSVPIRRVRSQSLSDSLSLGTTYSPAELGSQPSSPTPSTAATLLSNGERRPAAPPISWTSPIRSSSQTGASPQRANTPTTSVSADGGLALHTRRKLKRRSVPTPLPIVLPSPGSPTENSLASAKSDHVRFSTFSINESSEGEADESEIERDTDVDGRLASRDPSEQEAHRSKTPTQGSTIAPTRTRRAMTSPLVSPSIMDAQSVRSSQTASSSSSHQRQARHGTAFSQVRLEARSPFSAQGSPEWRKRHFPRQVSSYDDLNDDSDEALYPAGKKKDMVTATQALSDLVRQETAVPAPTPRSRKVSRDSLSSMGSSMQDKISKATNDPRRESVDSRASSNHSLRLFGRGGGKPSSVPASQTQSFGSVYSQASAPSPIATTSSGISAGQQSRRPRLEARDDRTRPLRPRFTSTRSTSSLPLNGDHADDSLDIGQALPSDDEVNFRNPRRASIPNASAVYAAGASAKANRASLAVPPAFGRSYSYDDKSSVASTSPHGRSLVESASVRERDMAQPVLLWIADELSASGSSKTGHGRQLTKVLLGNVPRKKVTKRDSSHTLAVGGTEERPSTAKGKERAKDRLPSELPLGKWKSCEAVLKPTGQMSLFSEHAYLTSISLTSLQRTDIRIADPSLLGKHRVLGIHLHETAFAPLPFNASRFPTSPSAPEFSTFGPASTSSLAGMRPSTARSSKGVSLEETSSSRPQLYLAFPSVATLHTWIVALQSHARPEVYPSLSRLNGSIASATVEEELSSSGREDVAPTRSPRQRQGTGGWRTGGNEVSDQPLRFYRSVHIEIVEVRGKRTSLPSSSTTTSNLHALAGLAISPPASHGQAYNPILQIRRTASIASGSSATGTEAGSEDSASIAATSPIPPSLPSLPNLAVNAHSQTQPPLLRTGSGDSKQEKDKDKDKKREGELIFCEICLDSEILARTSVKKASSTAVFHETFSFPNLPSFTNPISVCIHAVRRNQQILEGKVTVPLASARRNVKVQEWWPVTAPSDVALHATETIGELSMGVKVSEDVIMPHEAYEELEQLLTEDLNLDCLHSLVDAYPHLSLRDVSSLILRIDLAHQRLLPRLAAMCEREVQTCEGDAAILFRGNSLFTKSVELYMRMVGSDYLEKALGNVVRQICEEHIEIEIDPSRMTSGQRMSDNVRELERWTSAVWESIYNARHSCPGDMRRLFRKIQQIAERYFDEEHEAGRLGHLSDAERAKIHFTSISAFGSLRFFGPAILNPRLFGLCSPTDARTQRTLTLIAKVLQGLANMSTFGAKEPWMATMNPFLQANLSSFEDFIAHLCGKPDTAREEWTSQDCELYAVPLSNRKHLAPPIVKEGVPNLPFLIDLPRELAALATLVTQTRNVPEQRQRHASGSVSNYGIGHAQLQEVCHRIDTTTRARVRALERMGELGGSARNGSVQRPIARSESSARSSVRNRGTTISTRTAQSAAKALTPPRNNALYSSSPASNTSLSAEDSLASLTISSDLSSKTKRRSHTISAGSPISTPTPADSTHPRVHHATSPISSPAFSPSLRTREISANGSPPIASDLSGESDILEIHLPSSHDRGASGSSITSSKSHRRTTISANRPKLNPQLSEPITLTSLVPMPEPRTPRAVPTTAGASATSFAEMQREAALAALDGRAKGLSGGGIEHEIAAQEEAGPVKQKKGFFGFRK